MKRKQAAAWLMSVVMTAGMLAGCGKTEQQTEGTSQEEKQTSFQIAISRSDWGEDDKSLEGFVEESEQTAGIEIDWQIYFDSEWNDKKSVVLTNSDLPDAFLGCLSTSDVSKNKELFIPLEDLIEENMPNLTKIFEENPKLKNMATSTDGHIYGLPQRKPNRPKIRYQMFINQTWLDNLNLEMPETWEEFEEVLRAFKEQDANGNGDPNDEIPFGAALGNTVSAFILPFQHSGDGGASANATSLDTTFYYMTLEDGAPAFLPTEEGYKEGVAWMYECYAEGLIDAEIFTQDSSMQTAKLTNEEVPLVGVASTWTPDSSFGKWADQYVAMPALKGPDGQQNVLSMPEMGDCSAETFWITKDCSDPASLLKWIDSFYTDDATVQLYYGSFGVGSQKNEDGTYTILTPPEGEGADTWAWKNSFRESGPKYASDDLDSKISFEVTTEGDALKLELAKDLEQYVKPEFPELRYTDEELSVLQAYYPDIENYAKTMQAKWVTEGGIEEEWDTYLETLEQMNLGQVMEAVTSAYERFSSEE